MTNFFSASVVSLIVTVGLNAVFKIIMQTWFSRTSKLLKLWAALSQSPSPLSSELHRDHWDLQAPPRRQRGSPWWSSNSTSFSSNSNLVVIVVVTSL